MTNHAAPHVPSTCPQCSAPIAQFTSKRSSAGQELPDEPWTYRCEKGNEGEWEGDKPSAS